MKDGDKILKCELFLHSLDSQWKEHNGFVTSQNENDAKFWKN
jgi:hypothetical protein